MFNIELWILIFGFLGSLLVEPVSFIEDNLLKRGQNQNQNQNQNSGFMTPKFFLNVLGLVLIFIAFSCSIKSITEKETLRKNKQTLINRGFSIYQLEKKQEKEYVLLVKNTNEPNLEYKKIRKILSTDNYRLKDKFNIDPNENLQFNYYFKEYRNDQEILGRLYDEFEFGEALRTIPSDNKASDVNFVKFGAYINPDLAKAIVYLLLSSGREIKSIQLHHFESNITVGIDPNEKIKNCPVLSTKDVEIIVNTINKINKQIYDNNNREKIENLRKEINSKCPNSIEDKQYF